EFLDWLKLLLAESVPAEALRAESEAPPLHGALLKNEQDIALFDRLMAMARNRR
ncbi:MAG: ATP-binding protein, partial [Burkholderiaceae bacterium]